MTNHILVALALTACTTTESAPPTKVYDFSPASLQDLRQIDPKPGRLSKHTIRFAIQGVQPALLACYAKYTHEVGTIELRLRFIGDTDGTLVDAVDFEGDSQLTSNGALVECMRTIAMTLELPAMQEPGVWLVNYPFVAGTK